MIYDKRSLLLDWIERGALSPDRVKSALEVCEVLPTTLSWRTFLDRFLLFGGVVGLASAVIFFFAYNWDSMGRLIRFVLVESLILLTLAGYGKFGAKPGVGKALLLLASLLVGALLALFGQTYQTGADPWQLFALWALFILPWVILARFAALWMVWLVLLNVAVTLNGGMIHRVWIESFSEQNLLYVLMILNVPALLVWELAARRFSWLDERWAVRTLFWAITGLLTILMLETIFEGKNGPFNSLMYLVWLGAAYGVYRHVVADLFMLTAGSMSLIVVVTGFLAKGLFQDSFAGAGGLFVLAIAVTGMSTGAAFWLRNIRAEMNS